MQVKRIRNALLLAGAGAILAFAPSAAIAKKPAPYAKYAEVARAPLPSPMPAILHEQCPGDDWVAGCYLAAGEADITGRVFHRGAVFLSEGTSRFTKLHELGHAFDDSMLDPGERTAYAKLRHMDDLLWTWSDDLGDGMLVQGQGTPAEDFADAYASCRMQRTPWGIWETGYGYYPTPREHHRVCRLIVRAGEDTGVVVSADGDR